MMRLLMIFCMLGGLYAGIGTASSLNQQGKRYLIGFCDAVINHQITVKSNMNYGALRYPAQKKLCRISGEAVYPLAFTFKITQDKKYGVAAIRLANWVLKHQKNRDPKIQGLMFTLSKEVAAMAFAYPILEKYFNPKIKNIWKTYFQSSTQLLTFDLDAERMLRSSQELAWAAVALAATQQVFPDESFAEQTDKLINYLMLRMNEDGFFAEKDIPTDQAIPVDVGLAFESTLPALAIFSALVPRPDLDAMIQKSLNNHLYFLFPDGMIDNSCGIFSSNWRYWGQYDTGGAQPALSLFAPADARYHTAALKNMVHFAKNFCSGGKRVTKKTKSGSDSIFIALNPLIRRVTNLALMLQFNPGEMTEKKVLPSEMLEWYKHFKTLDVVVVRARNYMAIVSASHYKTDDLSNPIMQRPSGGALTNLWTNKIGFLQTYSPTIYPTELSSSMSTHLPLTSRIEYEDELGYFTNLYDFDGKLRVKRDDKALVRILFDGTLKNVQQQSGDVNCMQNYLFYHKSIKKEIQLTYLNEKRRVRLVEPFVIQAGTSVEFSNSHEVLIQHPREIWRFTLLSEEGEIEFGTASERFEWPDQGIQCFPITIILPEKKKDDHLQVVYRIDRKASAEYKWVEFDDE